MSKEEQMHAEFEAWWQREYPYCHESWLNKHPNGKYKSDAVRSAFAAYASNQREIYSLHRANESERGLNDALQRQVNGLNQQVLELSAQVGAMREALTAQRDLDYTLRGEVTGPQLERVTELQERALSTTPPAALEAHDNEVAAKVMEEAAAWADNCGEWLPDSTFNGLAHKFKEMAAELRSKK